MLMCFPDVTVYSEAILIQAVPCFFVLCRPKFTNTKVNFYPFLDENCLFIKFFRHPSYYLVVEMISSSDRPTKMIFVYHLISTTLGNASNENSFRDHNPSSSILEIQTINKLNTVTINQKEEAQEL